MFNESLTLVGTGPANHVYSTVDVGPYKRVRREANSDLNTPQLLTISHQVSKDGNKSFTLVRLDKSVEVDEKRGNIAVKLMIEVPRDVAVVADVGDAVNRLVSFIYDESLADPVSDFNALGKLVNLES